MFRFVSSLLLASFASLMLLGLGCSGFGNAGEACVAEFGKDGTEVTVTGDCNHMLCVPGPGNEHINCEETRKGSYFANDPCDVTGGIANGSVDIAGAACDYTCALTNEAPNGPKVTCTPN